MLLQTLLDRLTLLESDRLSLSKRGFSDAVIEKYQFRSCHALNALVLDTLKENFSTETLVNEGLFEFTNTGTQPYTYQRQLIEPNVLIPYSGLHTKEIAKIRPHKRGFKDQGAQVFFTHSTVTKPLTCVIAESEFKAVAAECFGYAAIGIPGIASMSGKNWDYFAEQLEKIDAKEYVICFDNEIKDNPNFSNFKADWRKRYDTIIYAYAMAQKILNIGRNCKIAQLPAEWMVDGKIDIDTALGNGIAADNFRFVIEAAQPPKAYLKMAPIPEKHVSYIARRVRAFFYNPQVEVKNNCFYTLGGLDENGNKQSGSKLTNCQLVIHNVYEVLGGDDVGVTRDLKILDEYGLESKPIVARAGDLVSKGAFKEWLMNHGNFLFYGGDQDLTKIWEYIFSQDNGNVVYLISQCGYIREFNFYLFKNILIHNSKAVYPDEQGIFWLDDVGYKANPLTDEAAIPALQYDKEFKLQEFLECLGNTMDDNGVGMGKTVFAYILSIIFIEEITSYFKLFPIFFLYGHRSSGKTTVIRWLTSFFGQNSATLSLTSSSPVGVGRGLAYYGGLPLVVDDWRNVPKLSNYITYFLGIYNRQSGMKGITKKFGVNMTPVRAALMVLGEEMFPDNALMSRCVSFYMPPTRIKECSEQMEVVVENASSLIANFLTERYQHERTQIVKVIQKYIKHFKIRFIGLDARIAINYAILAASYEVVIGVADEHLMDYIEKMIIDGSKSMIQGDKIHQFAEEFLVGVTSFNLQPHHYSFEGDVLLIWLKGACDTMNKFYNRQGYDQTGLITQHFMKQQYCEGIVKRALKPNHGEVPCISLILPKMPESLRELFEGGRDANHTASTTNRVAAPKRNPKVPEDISA